MNAPHPDRIVNDFVAGRLSRRQLIANLMAMGAAATGMSTLARAASPDDAASSTAPTANANEPTFTAQSVDHLALNVTDIPRSRDWYMRHLGMQPMRESRDSSFLRCANGRDFLALFKSDTPGMHHYSFAIERYNQQNAAERLRAAGLTPKLRGSRIYFDDPDGIEVQVSQG